MRELPSERGAPLFRKAALQGESNDMLIHLLNCETGKYATADGWSSDAGLAKGFATLAEAEAFCINAGVRKGQALVIRERMPPFRVSLTLRNTRNTRQPGRVIISKPAPKPGPERADRPRRAFDAGRAVVREQ